VRERRAVRARPRNAVTGGGGSSSGDSYHGRRLTARESWIGFLRMTRQSQRSVRVVDYDPIWPATFAGLRSRIWPAVQGVALAIEHVGSTAVPGLAAKPISDIDVIVASAGQVGPAVERLVPLGYVHRGNLGIAEREAFASPAGFAPHHLYVCVQESLAVANHLTIRDYLRRQPQAALTYGRLKQRLAQQFAGDRDGYNNGKTDFVLAVLRDVEWPAEALTTIAAANRTNP
jgi:GrpB-like predicted nucleotidyltransferase (UPF0157 family)